VPGTPLVNLLFDIYEIITYHRVTMDEPHALNHAACAWARLHVREFPIDPRPLRRRPSPIAAPDSFVELSS